MSNEELVNLRGGYGEGYFKCTCSSGVNSPYKSPWCKQYESSQNMLDDINKICFDGAGSCNSGCV